MKEYIFFTTILKFEFNLYCDTKIKNIPVGSKGLKGVNYTDKYLK